MDIEYRAEWPAPPAWRTQAMQAIGGGWRLRTRFLALSYLKARALAPLLHAEPGSSLQRYLQDRPDTAGFLVWPYQCTSWGPEERLRRVVEHFGILDELGHPLTFSSRDMLQLWNLERYSPDVRIILEQPKWLFREGLLALGLFCGNHRAYSLAFSLYREGGDAGIFIGGLQGRSTEGALERYKALTKDFHGMRPRDLLLDCLRMLAPALHARRILAVADDHRYVHDPLFSGNADAHHADYDQFWLERDGIRVAPSHFELPLAPSLRSLDDVPSRKRSQYRRRNEMLEELQEQVRTLPTDAFLRFEAT